MCWNSSRKKADKKQINKTILNSTRKIKPDPTTEGRGIWRRAGRVDPTSEGGVCEVGDSPDPGGPPRPGEDFGFHLKGVRDP